MHYGVQKGRISLTQWEEIRLLQEEYNKKYNWGDPLSLQRYLVYPNWKKFNKESGAEAWAIVEHEHNRAKGIYGIGDLAAWIRLARDGLVTVQMGGYKGSGWVMSGFTKIFGDEEKAYEERVLNFIRRASRRAPHLIFEVQNDKTGLITLFKGGQMWDRGFNERVLVR
jgi:hypothetical protein